MIIPSIDLQDGQAVQLVGGVDKVLDAGDPRPLATRFGRVGEVAVIDLDAAMGRGDHRALLEELLCLAPCRVGGGIRDAEAALAWLDAGAQKVILGTAAKPEILTALPRERVIIALDAYAGEVVIDGWRRRTGRSIEERLVELREYTDSFLITFVEREGRLGGIDLERAAALVELAGAARITFAGGITTADEIAALDEFGADAQVGMALYTGKLDLAEAVAATLSSDRPDGLWPTVVQAEDGSLLGLCYSSVRSLREALDTGAGVYESRRRGLWIKGATSGASQELLAVDLDCDRDTLRFLVRQRPPGFCHRGTTSCFVDVPGLPVLMQTLERRVDAAPPGSYTRRLLDDPELLRAKLREEADELALADGAERVAAEAADLFYFACVALTRSSVSLGAVWRELAARSLTVSRRPGDAKPGATPCSHS